MPLHYYYAITLDCQPLAISHYCHCHDAIIAFITYYIADTLFSDWLDIIASWLSQH